MGRLFLEYPDEPWMSSEGPLQEEGGRVSGEEGSRMMAASYWSEAARSLEVLAASTS